jgi:cell division protein FtsL
MLKKKIHEFFESQHPWQAISLDKQLFITASMWCLVIILCLGVVYSKHLLRVLYVQMQKIDKQLHEASQQQKQALLEQATWLSDARVGEIANKQLSMSKPKKTELVQSSIINEHTQETKHHE